MIPKFRFFGKVADGEMRMVRAESIDFENGFVYYSYHDYTVEGDDNVYGDTIGFEDCVLMQSTCLFDKNGNEIFEGDIVHAYSEGARLIGVIEYFDNAYCIKDKNGIYNSLWTNAEQYEIIGNIYKNPEFWEEE
ncbi:YopX family protein [Streptococcus infantarius]|uniref:YopX family protein n=1 Tax=Streptococcus infantarius TaxID=102684 RepID=UPI0022E314CE|nr:YopX family protein [Streptococcus infantarius]